MLRAGILALAISLSTGLFAGINEPVRKAQVAKMTRDRFKSTVVNNPLWKNVATAIAKGQTDFRMVGLGGYSVGAKPEYDHILDSYYLFMNSYAGGSPYSIMIFDEDTERFVDDKLQIDGHALLIPTGKEDVYTFALLEESKGDASWASWYRRWLQANKPAADEFEKEPVFKVRLFYPTSRKTSPFMAGMKFVSFRGQRKRANLAANEASVGPRCICESPRWERHHRILQSS